MPRAEATPLASRTSSAPTRTSRASPASAARRAARAATDDLDAPRTEVRWRHTVASAELAALARRLEIGPRLRSLEPAAVDPSGRWLAVTLHGESGQRTVGFDELRRDLGAGLLRSAAVDRTWPGAGQEITSGLYFEGRGHGHGVGLCQIGARHLGREGWSAVRILAHYYPGTRLGRLSPQGRFLSPTQ